MTNRMILIQSRPFTSPQRFLVQSLQLFSCPILSVTPSLVTTDLVYFCNFVTLRNLYKWNQSLKPFGIAFFQSAKFSENPSRFLHVPNSAFLLITEQCPMVCVVGRMTAPPSFFILFWVPIPPPVPHSLHCCTYRISLEIR